MQQDVRVSVRVGEDDIVDLLVKVIRLFDLWSVSSSVRKQSPSACPADVEISPKVGQHLALSPLAIAISFERNLADVACTAQACKEENNNSQRVRAPVSIDRLYEPARHCPGSQS